MKKILVLGGSGLVGKALINEMSNDDEYQMYPTYFQNPVPEFKSKNFKLDIENLSDISNILQSLKPQIVISCLRGDFEKQLEVHIRTAEYLKENDGKLYFCSTTNVFDNDLSKPHFEDDLTNSCTDYGRFKIECEKRIQDILHDNSCILRLPQMWGKDSIRINKLLNSLKNNEKIEVYPELFINTYTDFMLAKQIHYIVKHNLSGIFHAGSEDTVNYKDFFNELISGLGYSNPRIDENLDEKGYFVLLSKRKNEFPEEFRFANKSVIQYLIS